ncbi:MAG: hypothetical protein ACOZBL_02490 [Patescibacteria group bacterium]
MNHNEALNNLSSGIQTFLQAWSINLKILAGQDPSLIYNHNENQFILAMLRYCFLFISSQN